MIPSHRPEPNIEIAGHRDCGPFDENSPLLEANLVLRETSPIFTNDFRLCPADARENTPLLPVK